MDIAEIGAKIGIYFIPFLFALCFHEFAHGWVARLRGDNTAEQMGRLSMNPLVHMDMIGTFILPLVSIVLATPIFFGWAKPVPVNSRNLKNPRVDMFWIALAGPLSNILLAIVAAFLIGFLAKFFSASIYFKPVFEILKAFLMTNLFLAFFNMIPLHPLDGGKVLARFLPAQLNYKLEQNEQITSMVLMGLVLTGALRILAIPVFWSAQSLLTLALAGFGIS
ncbi:site-2 protease family protein [Bdellovibrio sp. HCB185ZH]|uniref:site-2 protease family protein n=1 Tax=Bdellovibrio TaxID=958 RepID=UPI0011581F05|nr:MULTISPECIES: site-2 protease family protein [unclassified Bdellovibrio]QDK45535.1 site-2 protease family protein [Bdellovibrio sp. ZAP7]QLY23780.1 site-2 protease family protein [Bdellovibrio sp. KM01]